VRVTAQGIKVGVVAALVLAMTVASAAATHTSKPRKPERPPQAATVQQEPQKRQNFRARRVDEFPPWEGFEDCPMAFPCVGVIYPY
jgi:hypothetical protein